MCLHEVRRRNTGHITLLSTVAGDPPLVAAHGVSQALLERQADALNLPLRSVRLAVGASNKEYEACMRAALEDLRGAGDAVVCYGDLFLEDLRRYREQRLAVEGVKIEFPLWSHDTRALVSEFLSAGYKTLITCVNLERLDESFAGKILDLELIERFPRDVDPCGENGEFHTFVFDGPLFAAPVPVRAGGKRRDGAFCFAELGLF